MPPPNYAHTISETSTPNFVTFVTPHKIPPTNTHTHDHQNDHPPPIGATHSPRTLSPPATLATVAGHPCPPYRVKCQGRIRSGVGRSSPPANTITPPARPHYARPRTRPPARTRNGGSAELPTPVYIYYPSVRCVVFVSHSGWWFGVFCDCGWWVFIQSSVYLCVRVIPPTI